jgi:hypothetical protein
MSDVDGNGKNVRGADHGWEERDVGVRRVGETDWRQGQDMA